MDKNANLETESKVNKLILLFFLDKMDVPLSDSIILEICYYHNAWLQYMECIQTMNQLLDSGLVYNSKRENVSYYSITPDGRMCLALFYTQIPTSVRAEITDYVKENRMHFRRRQEYCSNYKKNPDGTYTVQLKIMDSMQTAIDIKMNVSNKEAAKTAIENWKKKAANIYTVLYEQLIE